MIQTFKTKYKETTSAFHVENKIFSSPKDSIIFLVFLVVIPILWVAIRSFISPTYTDEIRNAFFAGGTVSPLNANLNLLSIVGFQVFSPLIGFLILSFRLKKKLFHNGFIFLFIIYPGQTILSLILNSFIANSQITTFIISVVLGLLAIVLITIANKNIIVMFKKNAATWKNIIVTFCVLAASVAIFYLLNFLFNLINFSINGNQTTSGNQTSLENQTGSAFGIASLFFSAVIVAPILEEYIYRMFFADVTNNKWYSYLITTFFFAFLHIQNFGDWNFIFLYFSLGIVNGFIYWQFKNITVPILLHFIVNFSSFLVIVL